MCLFHLNSSSVFGVNILLSIPFWQTVRWRWLMVQGGLCRWDCWFLHIIWKAGVKAWGAFWYCFHLAVVYVSASSYHLYNISFTLELELRAWICEGGLSLTESEHVLKRFCATRPWVHFSGQKGALTDNLSTLKRVLLVVRGKILLGSEGLLSICIKCSKQI